MSQGSKSPVICLEDAAMASSDADNLACIADAANLACILMYWATPQRKASEIEQAVQRAKQV